MQLRRLAPALLALILAGHAGADGIGDPESILLPLPILDGELPAATYGDKGRRLGAADLSMEARDDGTYFLRSYTAIDGADATTGTSLLRRDGDGLRIVWQESRSIDEDRNPLGLLRVDHEQGVATCHDPAGEQVALLELPANERVVNVPQNLLLQPLMRGESQEIAYQMFVCGLGARLVDARARLGDTSRTDGLREIHLQVQLGGILSLANSVLPKVTYWHDPKVPGGWVAHRIPLYARGPIVTVVRSGYENVLFMPPGPDVAAPGR